MRKWAFWILAGATLALYLTIVLWSLPTVTAGAGGLTPFDLRPGGMTHYHMQAPDGKLMWGRAIYREVVPPSKLVWINSFSDQDGGITRHPMTTEPWPLQLLTTITFAEKAGRTTVTVHWLPYESDETERRVFDSGRESMKLGWGGTLDQCDAYLKEN